MRWMRSGAAIALLLLCAGCASTGSSADPATVADTAQPTGPKQPDGAPPTPSPEPPFEHHGGCAFPPEPIPDAPSGPSS
ncbi:MAG: hypothetical protein KGL26_05925 [Pseudomonadota bacterium]|nr:hypothetical protein [Pseudomonadota bacterium]